MWPLRPPPFLLTFSFCFRFGSVVDAGWTVVLLGVIVSELAPSLSIDRAWFVFESGLVGPLLRRCLFGVGLARSGVYAFPLAVRRPAVGEIENI